TLRAGIAQLPNLVVVVGRREASQRLSADQVGIGNGGEAVIRDIAFLKQDSECRVGVGIRADIDEVGDALVTERIDNGANNGGVVGAGRLGRQDAHRVD